MRKPPIPAAEDGDGCRGENAADDRRVDQDPAAERGTGLANARVHDAVLGCLRQAGFSIEMTIQAMSVQDAYIYGFALQEKDVPFETAEESAAVAEGQGWDDEALAKEFPYLAEV